MKIFTDIIKKFRSSTFAEYAPMLLVLLMFSIGVFYLADKNPSINKASKTIDKEDKTMFETSSTVDSPSYDDIYTIATSTAQIRGYVIEYATQSNRPWGSETLRITRNDKELYSITDDSVYPVFREPDVNSPDGWSNRDASYFLKWAIKDITNNGIPEIGVVGYSGGAHCCDMNYIIELSNPIKVLFKQDTGDGSMEVIDLDGDGVYEITVLDDVLDYWNTGHASSPFPTVIFSYQNGTYKVAPAYMRKPVPSEATLKTAAAAGWTSKCVEKVDGIGIYCSVPWKYAADLVYSGNAKAARDYIDLAWKDNEKFESKEIFIREFVERFREGIYYKDLTTFLNLKALLR